MVEQRGEQHERAIAARNAATSVVRKLVNAGYVAFFAGGCVRDRLMGHEPLDYDVATSASPKQILQIFPRAQAVGESFGVMLIRSRGHSIEVATFRTEGVYSDGRHPDEVQFSDAEHDAQRRDFTINGLFENPLTDEIVDYVGGRADLEAKVIRAIGNAHDRLREDRLRMLRAVRFAARFAFELDADTADAIRTGAEKLQGVSRERIGQEVRRMFMDANRAVAAWEMQYLGLDQVVLMEDHSNVAPTRVGRLPDRIAYPTVLTAWLLDRHESISPGLAALQSVAGRWGQALVLSNAELLAVQRCLEAYVALRDNWETLGVARQKRLAAQVDFDQALAVYQTTDRSGFINVKRRVQFLAESELAPEPILTGRDLIAAGWSPGPHFGQILDAVYDSQLEGHISEHEQALALVQQLMEQFLDR
jgi:poly(A) polymerase